MKCQQYEVSFIIFISPIILWFKSFSDAVWLSEFKTASSQATFSNKKAAR